MRRSFRGLFVVSATALGIGACSASEDPGIAFGGSPPVPSGGATTATGVGGTLVTGGSLGIGGTSPGGSGAGTASAGSANAGTTSNGGASSGGAFVFSGGASNGGTSNGGTSNGGTTSRGGANSGGASFGGANAGAGRSSSGGAATGGALGAGGRGSGGFGMGGAAMGGAAMGGRASGGAVGSGGSGSSTCSVSPVDPNATQQAKNLLCYLVSIYGNHVLSGQQETSWSNPANDISFYTGNASIGKAPAILGGDFLYVGTGTASQGTTTSRAQAYWAAGGISMIRYHMGAPPNADSYANSMLGYTSAQCQAVITAGSSENTSYLGKLNAIAANLQTLQSAGVPVILALFHETQAGGWFWWSKCSGPQFIALYSYTYNYLMNTKGIHNILRLMPFSGSPSAAYYPGKSLVDLSGGDTYGTNPPFTSLYSTCRNIAGSTLPLALHETGVVPQPSTMFPSSAPWLLWNIWAGYESSNNSVANIASAYASPYTITRDEVPNLK